MLAIEETLRVSFHWQHLEFVNVITVWSFVQAIWLKKAEASSKAIYWVLAGHILDAVNSALILFGVWNGSSTAASMSKILLVLSLVLIYSGVLVFRQEMQSYFNETDIVGLELSLPMSVIFNTLYFQYHFQKIAHFKQKNASLITPVAG